MAPHNSFSDEIHQHSTAGYLNGHANVLLKAKSGGGGGGGGEYLSMGRELLRNMETLEDELKLKNLAAPTLSAGTPSSDTETGNVARKKVSELAQRILATTMDPGMNLLISSLQFHFCSSLKVAVDLDIAAKIPQHGQVSAQELADATGAEKALLVRIMRVLVAKYVFAENKPEMYSHTAMSWVMCTQDQKYLLKHRLDESFRSSARQADALRLHGYREPVLGDKYGFNLGFQTQENFWHFITTTEPHRGENFNNAMRAVNINSLNMIPDLYPFNKLGQNGGLIVDIGGGLGQVGGQILGHYPNSGLRCVVQDEFVTSGAKPETNGFVENGEENHEVKAQITLEQHNFFDPQPIKGAAAYFLRHILHDWPDGACITILRQIVPAMDEANSRILICDQVMDEQDPSLQSILYDIDMMSMFGGKERKLSEWEVLIKAADERLHITDVRKSSSTAILEVRLK